MLFSGIHRSSLFSLIYICIYLYLSKVHVEEELEGISRLQSYQTNIISNNNLNENASYILKILNKKSYIQILKIELDTIYMIIEINKKNYSLNICIDNKKPSYIFINIDNLKMIYAIN